MTNAQLIEACEKEVRALSNTAEKGHDWFHINRVRNNALKIQALEGGDRDSLELAALLHDIDDAKFNGGDEKAGAEKAFALLLSLGASEPKSRQISDWIAACSYKGGNQKESDQLEVLILRDADRLDAIGAIGIARCFHYGGFKNQAIYDPDIPVRDRMSTQEYRQGPSSSINHFHEKLLKLKEGMYTATAKAMAEERHQFMLRYLEQFYEEWSQKEKGPPGPPFQSMDRLTIPGFEGSPV
ncbi:HD domain-containing protein [Croceimicrobium sp.]|uniref:HD domain-containing protein n=1 Tax=Croceimicrobium sp. TaxID=2828340 RepID=UPI003BAD4E24